VSEKRELVRNFLKEVLSEVFAPSFYVVLEYHTSKMLGEDFTDCLMRDPRKAYEIMTKVLNSEYTVHILDSLVSRHLRSLGIDIKDSIMKLKEGDNKLIILAAEKYFKLRRRK